MCIKTDPRGSYKSTQPSRNSPPKQKQKPKPTKPSKQLETNHQETTATIEQTPTSAPTKVKKSVSFHAFDKVNGIIHISEYTEQEIADCWYSRAERNRTGAKIRSSIKLFKQDKESFDKTCTLRGLERYSTSSRTIEKRRKKSVTEVLKEQESQRERARANNCELRIYDGIKIRKAYKRHSKAALDTAHAIGIIDEMKATSKKGTLIIPNNRNTRNVLTNVNNAPTKMECLRV